VRLELHRIGAGLGDRVDERMRDTEAPVVRLRHLCDDETAGPR
jgi:hypothetical protein